MQVEGNYSKDKKTGAVKTTHFTAKGLSKMGADNYMFEWSPNRDTEPVQMSVAEHFSRNLGIPLKNPKYPCVVVRAHLPTCTHHFGLDLHSVGLGAAV